MHGHLRKAFALCRPLQRSGPCGWAVLCFARGTYTCTFPQLRLCFCGLPVAPRRTRRVPRGATMLVGISGCGVVVFVFSAGNGGCWNEQQVLDEGRPMAEVEDEVDYEDDADATVGCSAGGGTGAAALSVDAADGGTDGKTELKDRHTAKGRDKADRDRDDDQAKRDEGGRGAGRVEARGARDARRGGEAASGGRREAARGNGGGAVGDRDRRVRRRDDERGGERDRRGGARDRQRSRERGGRRSRSPRKRESGGGGRARRSRSPRSREKGRATASPPANKPRDLRDSLRDKVSA